MTRRNISGMLLTLLLLLYLPSELIAQDIPDKPYPPRLVNDFSGILSSNEANALENKLVAFNDSTSTQIAIVIVDDLGGYDKSDYAFRLAEKWGIGQKGLDNGILILVKPKTQFSSGEAFIATGYGLEGVIPDILCGEITDYEMIPAFRNNDYYGGLEKATTTLMALASGEYTADEYGKKGSGDAGGLVMFIIFVIVLIIILSARSKGGKNQKHLSNKGLPLWLLLSMMNSGRGSHSGSWGGFSGGGGGGGFGGFGGGSFGGGGAGGSW
jgi:uncharacterized protein